MYPKTRALIQSLIKDQIIPGASYAFIEKDQKVIYRDGLAALTPKKEAIKENQQYDVASLTKVILTTTIMLQLLETKTIGLEDPIQVYLPKFNYNKVTIRHLLTHTSALNGFIPNRDRLTAIELKDALLILMPDNTLGKKVKYADINMILLGYIIEEIKKETLFSVFEQEILMPLKLTDSTYLPSDPAQCAPTENDPLRGMIRGVVHDPKALILGEHCGSAGLFSTIADTIRFSQMMLQKGKLDGVRIVEETTISQLTSDWTPNGELNRSLGWDLRIREQDTYLFHTGFTGTFILLNLKKQDAFIFLSNRVHPISDTEKYLEKREELIEHYLLEKETAMN